MRDSISDSVSDWAFALGWDVVRKMPAPVARTLFDAFADQAWVRHGESVQQLERNLARVVPELSTRELRELSRAGMRSYLRYWREAFRLPDLSPEELLATFVCLDEHYMTDAIQARKGTVLVLPHMGNWDHAGAWLAVKHESFTTVAERLKPESLYQRFVDYRRSLGMEVLPLSGGGGPFRVLLERARAGRAICLLADRDLTENGVPVTFFGETATMPAGPAALALASGGALVPVTTWYEGSRTMCRIHRPIEVPTEGARADKVAQMTQAFATVFESAIAEHPQDWHMLQRLWSVDVEAARLARAARAAR